MTLDPLSRPHTLLCIGTPRFMDSELASLVAQGGAAQAWHVLVERAAQDAPTRVDGDFAIALRTASGGAFLAVDRFAIQTLCYRVVDGNLHVAERADDLAAAGGVHASIDLQAIFDYLLFHTIPSPRTIYEGIYRLPPGHCAAFEAGSLTVKPYWTAVFTEPRAPYLSDLKHEFQALLRDAVGRQLDGSPRACFLSGGTDSSTVAGLLAEHDRRAGGPATSSYSIGFEAEGYDEMAYARVAAKHFGTTHHEYYVTPEDLVRSIGDVARAHDQPFGNSSALPAYYCAKMARADGVTRLLAGDGGDELFGGNSRYAKQRMFGWYRHVPEVLQRGLLEPLLQDPRVAALPLLRKGASYIEQARVPMPERMQMYNLLLRLGVTEVLTPAFRARIDQGLPLEAQRGIWAQAVTEHEINRMLAYDWRYTLSESDLPKVRVSTRLAGVDVGFPLLDGALLDFSMRLPAEYKLKGLKLRWFFKEALRGFLPDSIITKRKQGFGLPFGVWAVRHLALQGVATDALHSLSRRGIVNPTFIAQLIRIHLPAHPGYYGEMVWVLMMLEHWLQARAPGFEISH